MITLTKSKTIAASKDLLVVLTDPARLRELDLERGDRQYLIEQLNGGRGRLNSNGMGSYAAAAPAKR